MNSNTICLYPGYLTKGMHGKLVWHPRLPRFNNVLNDWSEEDTSVNVSPCIQDPWPDYFGGRDCIMQITND